MPTPVAGPTTPAFLAWFAFLTVVDDRGSGIAVDQSRRKFGAVPLKKLD
jgi:hypothetical protein